MLTPEPSTAAADSVASTRIMQACSLLFAGIAQIGITATLLQAYADKSFHRWYELKHGGDDEYKDVMAKLGADKDATKRKEIKSAILDAILQSNDALFGKAALQMVAPALLFVSAGALLLLRGGGAPGLLVEADAGTMALWRCVGGFVGCWTSAWWIVCTAGAVWLRNTGVMA